MSVSLKSLMAENITFAAACRENTGRNAFDSGGAYGRHHERPDLPENLPEILGWEKGCSATISTSAFLGMFFEIQRDLQKQWELWDEEQENLNWFESGQKFMEEKLGYIQQTRGNIYNNENDMSQGWVYEVYTKEDPKHEDWIYNTKGTITIIYLHTGCDVRGGYGRPIFCKSTNDYCVPIDLQAEYKVEEILSGGEENLDPTFLDETWMTGWSSCPYGKLRDDVKTWLEDTRTRDSVQVILKTGEHILVRACAPYIG